MRIIAYLSNMLMVDDQTIASGKNHHIISQHVSINRNSNQSINQSVNQSILDKARQGTNNNRDNRDHTLKFKPLVPLHLRQGRVPPAPFLSQRTTGRTA